MTDQENTEENTEEKKRTRGQYYVCSVIASFDRKRDLVKYIEDQKLESTPESTVIHGNKKTITRANIPIIDVS